MTAQERCQTPNAIRVVAAGGEPAVAPARLGLLGANRLAMPIAREVTWDGSFGASVKEHIRRTSRTCSSAWSCVSRSQSPPSWPPGAQAP